MDYIELTAEVAARDADAASALLRTLADGGAWIEAPFTQPDLESDAIVDASAPARVHVYFRGDDAAANASLGRMALARAGIAAGVAATRVAEEDWAEAWKDHFHVDRFGERIVVVPSWRDYTPSANDVVLSLDPGMAFGTGQHETTRMCLEALEAHVRTRDHVLDVGCGSGILSLAAAKLGAAEVVALDIDDLCVRVARENARANGVDGVVHPGHGSLGEAWPFEFTPDGRFNIVVANIIARVVAEMAAPLLSALAPRGRLIVSGIIEEREQQVTAALESAGGRVGSVRAMGDWRCIEAVHA